MSDVPVDQAATVRKPASPKLDGDPDGDAGAAKAGAGAARPARPGPRLGAPGPITLATSIVAVLFSGVSLYETLKPARPKIYMSDAMLLGRRGSPDYVEAVVLPVTIVNYGSGGAVVTRIRLGVRMRGAPETRTMGSAYSGDTPTAERLFTPVPIAGHQSAAASVVFTPMDGGEQIFKPGAVYEFCLTVQAEADDDAGTLAWMFAWLPAFQPASFQFSATMSDFDRGQLAAGQVEHLRTVGHPAPSCDFPG